jgi:hypothetical protein
MARQIEVNLGRTIPATSDRVHALVADYVDERPRILPPANYLDYKVLQGGRGAGTLFSYRLKAAGRERPYEVEVTEPTPGATLVERDRNSSLVTNWTLTPASDGASTEVRLSTSWEGGEGIGGFFERTFAPRGLRRIQEEMLTRLAARAAAPG